MIKIISRGKRIIAERSLLKKLEFIDFSETSFSILIVN